MKKIFILTTIIFAALNFTNAQAKMESADTRADKWVKNVNPTLKMTPEQQTKVKAFALQWINETDANKAKFGTDKKGLDAADEASGKTFKANVNSVLTPEQQKTWKNRWIITGRQVTERLQPLLKRDNNRHFSFIEKTFP